MFWNNCIHNIDFLDLKIKYINFLFKNNKL